MRGGRRSSWPVAVLCATLCSMILLAPAAKAAKRVALVIGNDTYDTLPALNNARADAKGMAEKLRGLGFDVILKLNASSRDMGRALADFEGRAANAEVGLVFYAGHGIQAGGTNYLVPANAQIEVEEDLRFEGVASNEFLQAMKRAGTGLNIVILDACRDNPLPKRTRSAARGLTVTAAPAGIRGTAIVYSAAPGQTAQDGPRGGHGVFTGELLRVLDRPGLSLEQVFKQTAIQVSRATNNKQKPWINSSITGDFIFNASAPAAPSTSGTDREALFWSSIKDSRRATDFEAYLEQYPNGIFAALARSRAQEYGVDQTAALPPPVEPAVKLEPLEAIYVALRNANVRSAPDVGSTKVETLAKGSNIYVPGKVASKNWLAVSRDGRRLGYVYGKLLQDQQVYRAARAEEEQAKVKAATEAAEAARRRAAVEQRRLAALEEARLEKDRLSERAEKERLEDEAKKRALANSARRQVKTFKDCDKCPEMVVIPPGQFRMGDLSGDGNDDEKPVRDVRIDYRFAVGVFEVTQAQWRAVMGSNPSHFKGNDRPVEQVSWEDAKDFVERLSGKTGKEYRLLSEAEWEYVARAGTTTRYHWGNDFDNSKAAKGSATEPVGSHAPNAFGLHDVHGNVWEWTEDCWNRNYSGSWFSSGPPADGSAWLSGNCNDRILRGGSWHHMPGHLRAAFRYWDGIGYRGNNFGFRVARTYSR
jgi:formylglycine-generating enzyme required for sulfatase activity